MDKKKAENIALFRYGIISPLISCTTDDSNSKESFFRNAAAQDYTYVDGKIVKFHYHTIKRWYLSYKHHGFNGLIPKTRSDKSKSRKLDKDIYEQIEHYLNTYPKVTASFIYRQLIANSTIKMEDISLSTITRIVNRLKKEHKMPNKKERLRYEMAHINDVWCADTSHGPYIKIDGKKCKTYIIALIDDASRYIVGADVFFNDNYVSLMKVIKSSVTRCGKPKKFNFDNGATYKSTQMNLLAARIGSTIHYCAPYSPQEKAKIERWFRTMKDQWMNCVDWNEFKSIDDIRKGLHEYIQKYNQTVHSSLNGKTPQDRFFEESKYIIRLNEKQIEESFLLEIERKVSIDNVIKIDNNEYEVPYIYAGLKLKLRYSSDYKDIYIVDEDTGELTRLNVLNKVANAQRKRQKVMMTQGD